MKIFWKWSSTTFALILLNLWTQWALRESRRDLGRSIKKSSKPNALRGAKDFWTKRAPNKSFWFVGIFRRKSFDLKFRFKRCRLRWSGGFECRCSSTIAELTRCCRPLERYTVHKDRVTHRWALHKPSYRMIIEKFSMRTVPREHRGQ